MVRGQVPERIHDQKPRGGTPVMSFLYPGSSTVRRPADYGTGGCIQSQALGQEDPLGKEMATHSSILAWKIPWTEEAGGLQSMGSQESDMTEQHFHI